MNAQQTDNSPKIKRETKNTIRVDFERTSLLTRIRLKFFTAKALGNAIWFVFRLILLLGVSYVILQPFYSKLASSFMAREDFVDVTVKLLPKNPTLDTYKAIIIEADYFKVLLNTTLLSASLALIQTFICAVVAYGFAKYKFKGSKLLFALVLLTMIVPHKTLRMAMQMKFNYFDIGFGNVGILNLLGGGIFEDLKILDFTSLHLTDSFIPLYLLALGGLAFKNGLYIFMLRQFFRGVPDELEESAYIDGYGPFKTFFKIILPISIPMLITVFLFSFSWQWTDNYYVNLFYSHGGPDLMHDIIIIPKALDINYAGKELYSAAIRNTAGILILAPLLIMYLFLQRYLVEGIERSGIVG